MKLSLRLATAFENSLPGYPLWDICCDHGLLGIHALMSKNFPEVHFVDQVPKIMSSLSAKIERKRTASMPLASCHLLPAENIQHSLEGSVCVLGVGAQKIEIFLNAWEGAGLLQAKRLILGPHKDEVWFLKNIIPSLKNYQLQKQIDVLERGRKRTIFILDKTLI